MAPYVHLITTGTHWFSDLPKAMVCSPFNVNSWQSIRCIIFTIWSKKGTLQFNSKWNCATKNSIIDYPTLVYFYEDLTCPNNDNTSLKFCETLFFLVQILKLNKYYSHGYGNLNQLAFWMMNSFLSVLPSSSFENPLETVIIAQMAHMTTIVNKTGKSLKICKRTLCHFPFLYATKGTDTFLKYCENKVMKIIVPIATPQFLAA